MDSNIYTIEAHWSPRMSTSRLQDTMRLNQDVRSRRKLRITGFHYRNLGTTRMIGEGRGGVAERSGEIPVLIAEGGGVNNLRNMPSHSHIRFT